MKPEEVPQVAAEQQCVFVLAALARYSTYQDGERFAWSRGIT